MITFTKVPGGLKTKRLVEHFRDPRFQAHVERAAQQLLRDYTKSKWEFYETSDPCGFFAFEKPQLGFYLRVPFSETVYFLEGWSDTLIGMFLTYKAVKQRRSDLQGLAAVETLQVLRDTEGKLQQALAHCGVKWGL